MLIKNLIAYLLLNGEQDMVIDMEAGLEHLGRGVTEKVDALFIVVRPDRVSCLTARRIYTLARELKIPAIYAVGNQVRGEEDKKFLENELRDLEFAAFFPFSEVLAGYERQGRDTSVIPKLKESAETLIGRIMEVKHG